eukprot:symbB.v1.2.008216.t1/scaffold492.1/size196413/19
MLPQNLGRAGLPALASGALETAVDLLATSGATFPTSGVFQGLPGTNSVAPLLNSFLDGAEAGASELEFSGFSDFLLRLRVPCSSFSFS